MQPVEAGGTMAELIPVGIVRAQRFIALHLIAQAGKPVPMPAEEPILTLRANLEGLCRTASLTGRESGELSRALAYLAYNMTRAGSATGVGLARAADWTFHIHKRSSRGLNPVPTALLPRALELWKQGAAIGALSLTDESVDFCRTETRHFFCALFILAQPLDPAHLRWLSQPHFADAWRAGAVLDAELLDRLAAILRDSWHQRAPLWAARVLSYIGGTHVSRLFWTVLGDDPGTISNTHGYPSQNEQDEAAVILTRVRALFHHCLVRALRRGDGQAREYCGHLMRHLRHDKQIFGPEWDTFLPPELVPLLQDEQPAVRIEVGAILLILNKHLQPLVGSAMLEILSHPDPNVRWEAAMVMARAGGRRASEPLLEAVKAGSHRQRSAAMRCLGDLGDPRAVPALIDVL